jgi:hypothetical protein
MGAVRPSPEPGTLYIPSGSLGRWRTALVCCVVGALISGLLYAFGLMSEPVRALWTTPGRGAGPIAGLAGGVCSIVAIALYVLAIASCRVASRRFARALSIGVGVVILLTCVVALLGQAPLGDDSLIARRPVAFRDVGLGRGAFEVLAEPQQIGARLQGLRAIAGSDKVLFANVLLGALICAAVVGDLAYRFAGLVTNGFMLDERTGDWFRAPVEVGAFERLGQHPTYADIPDLVHIPEDDAVADLVAGETVLILYLHPSARDGDREVVLVSIDEVVIRPKRFLRSRRAAEREVLPPTFISVELFDALLQGRS